MADSYEVLYDLYWIIRQCEFYRFMKAYYISFCFVFRVYSLVCD